jgi:hypothetical protein
MSFDASNSAFLVILMDEVLDKCLFLTEDELREITDGKDAKSTKNSTKYAANTFRNYLRNKNLPEDFENWSKADLDSRLRCFYAEVRSASGMDEVLDKCLLIPFLIENSEICLYNSPLALLTSA